MGALVAIICLAMAGISIAFSIIGTPLPFMKKDNQCLSAWGYKLDCSQSDYTYKTDDLPICDQAKSRLKAVGSFEIIGIAGASAAGVCILFGLICKKPLFKWLAAFTGILGAIAFLIVVGIEGAQFKTDVCSTGSTYSDQGWTLTSGFALVVISWVLSMVFPVILCVADPGFSE